MSGNGIELVVPEYCHKTHCVFHTEDVNFTYEYHMPWIMLCLLESPEVKNGDIKRFASAPQDS